MTEITETNQKVTGGGAYIELFEIDLTPIGGSTIYRFTAAESQDSPTLTWRGEEYTPVPITAEGFEIAGDRSFPRPKLRLANILGTGTQIIQQAFNLQNTNLKGAKVTRWRTWERHLDDGEDPNPNAHFLPDIYWVSRKSNEDFMMVEWELASRLDLTGKKIGRLALRNACTFTGRIWDVDHGVWINGTCPWKVGAAEYTGKYYDRNGIEVATPAEDKYSKRFGTCCRPRYQNNQMPFRGFPSVGRFR